MRYTVLYYVNKLDAIAPNEGTHRQTERTRVR